MAPPDETKAAYRILWKRFYDTIAIKERYNPKCRMRNILIVWFCTGFWHGASWNFILWGLYFAGWLILEKYVLRSVLEKTPAWVKHFYTLLP